MTATSATSTLLLLLLILPVVLSPPATAGARDSLPRDGSIAVEDHATDVLVSPDGTFACGFYAVSPTVFTFSVWFARAEGRTVVWTAAGARRVVHSQGSRITLDGRRGALVLADHDGEVVWNSTSSGSAVRARLLDSGNLAIEDARGGVLWQSS